MNRIGIRALDFGREAQTKAHAWGVNEAPDGTPVAACRSEAQPNFGEITAIACGNRVPHVWMEYLSTKAAAEAALASLTH